jgi:hypothetical protein
MKCQEVNEMLVVYSDGEVTPSERALIQVHLAECEFCQEKLAALSATQARIRRSLQVRAAQSVPSPQTWSRLQAKLASEASPSLPWLQRLALDIGCGMTRVFQGGTTAKKGFSLAAIAVLVIVVGMVVFVPSVRAQVEDAIRRIALGAHSWAVQVIPQIGNESQPLPADVWIVHTEIGGFAGNAPPGVDPTVRSVADFEEAQASTSFHLRAPTDLPEGYILREVKLAPNGETNWAFLFYSGPDHDIIVVQLPVGPQPSDEPNTTVSAVAGLITDGTLEEVDFDGHPAVWVNGHGLMWEADGISYTVGGLDLSLEETLQIARSLR